MFKMGDEQQKINNLKKLILKKKKIDEIIKRYFKKGPFKAKKLVKIDTAENSKSIKDKTWQAGTDLINEVIDNFYNFDFENKSYKLKLYQIIKFQGLLAEIIRTFSTAFKLAEEGDYRIAFAELRDILEFVIKIKFFYNNPEHFDKWTKDPNKVYAISDILPSFNEQLKLKINDFQNVLSINRHGSSFTLDSFGEIICDINYYKKEQFEKWCKHMITLKDLSIEIISTTLID